MRLFVALEIPEEIRAELGRRAQEMRRELPRARWVRPENLHLTLAFLGETDSALLPDLGAALRGAFAARPRLELVLGGAGTFPERGPARVAWVGVDGGPELIRLQAEVEREAFRALGREPEPRAFHPHLTLARCAPPWPRRAGDRFRIAFAAPPAAPIAVAEGLLVESRLATGGPRYTALEAFPLEGGR